MILPVLPLLAWGFFSLAPSHPGLTVSGTNLLAMGKPVMLRGVAVGDPVLARNDRPASDYARIASDWHANVVRMGIHPGLWKKSPREATLAKLKADVTAALDNGMYVIIDWHVIGWPDGYFQKPDPEWDEVEADFYDSNFDLAKSFWSCVAREFGKDGRILFELWNEPVYSSEDSEVESRWQQLKPKWIELQKVVRKYSDNVILVTGDQWAYNFRGIREDPLPGPNVAYAWHIYAGHDENDPKQWAEALDELQNLAPVIVSEWGFQRNSTEHFRGTPQSFGNKFLKQFLQERHLHSTAWCWHPDWTPVMLRRDWKTPTEMGTFVRDYLRANNP